MPALNVDKKEDTLVCLVIVKRVYNVPYTMYYILYTAREVSVSVSWSRVQGSWVWDIPHRQQPVLCFVVGLLLSALVLSWQRPHNKNGSSWLYH